MFVDNFCMHTWSRLRRHLQIKALACLPKPIRHNLIRRNIIYPSGQPQNIRFKLAETKEELSQAFRLLHNCYVSQGYMAPHPSQMRLTKYHMLPSSSTLVAVENGEVIATVSLIRSSPFGLPSELAYNIDSLKKRRARIAEISALAIHPNYARKQGYLLQPLTKFMVEYCRRFFSTDYLAFVVTPQWFSYYEAVWFAKPFTERNISYDYVNGTKARGGYLVVRHMATRSELMYENMRPENNQFLYMFQSEFDCFDFPSRDPATASDPVMTPELLRYFFKEQSNVIGELSDTEIRVLRHLYNSPAYDSLFPKQMREVSDFHFGEKRFEVECPAKIVISTKKQIPMVVRSVSHSGLGGIANRELRNGDVYTLCIDVAKHQTISIRAKVIWKEIDGACGFTVLTRSLDWPKFIDSLDVALLTPA